MFFEMGFAKFLDVLEFLDEIIHFTNMKLVEILTSRYVVIASYLTTPVPFDIGFVKAII